MQHCGKISATLWKKYLQKTENAKNVEGLVISKFKIKLIDGKKQYALLLISLTEASKGRRQSFESNVHNMAPLYDFLADFSIIEGNRFFSVILVQKR